MDLDSSIETWEIFPWNESFATNIEEIDEQHKQLIKLLNQLARNLTQDQRVAIESTFDELAQYANYHFQCEEKIWEKYFSNKALHQKHTQSHSSFLPKVLELQEQNKEKPYEQIVEEILLFLIRWLAFHIIDEDKRMAMIIHGMQEGKSLPEATYEADHMMSGSMKSLIEAILSMYDNLSLKAIKLIRERKARIKAQKELKVINKKLEALSITDQLTGLFNRRYFEQIFQQELHKAQRNQTHFSVILFDIDYFKKLNDTYGHAKGDEALIKVSERLRTLCKRADDNAFRIGGEEFCVIVTHDKDRSAVKLAQMIQSAINALKIENKKSDVSEFLTISAGIVSKIPLAEESVDSIMALADERLYQAKDRGRDQLVWE